MTDAVLLCPYCGAYSRRSCEWDEMTGNPFGEMRESAPCVFDEWDAPDPDMARDDRDERKRLELESPSNE